MMNSVSYSGLTIRELRALYRQWLENTAGYRCEIGHDACGCTTEASQDGKAPCMKAVLDEVRWRNAATETVEGENEQLRRYQERAG